MGSIKSNNLKAEKARAIYKHRLLRRIASLFRFFEISVILVLILRVSIQLPLVVKNSNEYFRDFSIFVVNPRIVFLIGNAIIILIFALSGQFSPKASESNSLELDFYEEFIQNSTRSLEKQSTKTEYGMKSTITKYDMKSQGINEDQFRNLQEKEMTNSKRLSVNQIECQENQSTKQIIKTEGKNRGIQSKKTGETNTSSDIVYRRCQSGDLSLVVRSERSKPILQRSETDNSRKRGVYPEDGMSNEEFRRTIEAFIERQQRLRMEEENLVV